MTGGNNSGSSDGWPERAVTRPVTPRQVAELLGEKPFQVIFDLMRLNEFASVNSELSDEVLYRLGGFYRTHFKIADGEK